MRVRKRPPGSVAEPRPAGGGQSRFTRNNRWIFESVEFDEWANRQSASPALNAEEAYLTARFFDKDSPTLDAGTGGGRVALALRNAGHTDLHAFDFVPGSIVQARARDPGGAIQFEVMDATDLRYAADTFAQEIYPLNVIGSIEGATQRRKAIREAQRVLRPGGLAIISAYSFEGAHRSKAHAAFIRYLSLLRFLRRSNRPRNDLPWLRLRRRINWSALADRGPYLHWYTLDEFADDILQSGLAFEAIATDWQIEHDHLCPSVQELATEPLVGMFYGICRKQPRSERPVGDPAQVVAQHRDER